MKIGWRLSLTAGAFALTVGFQNCEEAIPSSVVSSNSQQDGSSISPDPTPSRLPLKAEFYSLVNGVKSSTMYIDEVIHGEISGANKDTLYGCSTLTERASECDNLSIWSKIPNNEWAWDNARNVAVLSMKLDWLIPPDKEVVSFYEDRSTGQKIVVYMTLKSRPVTQPICSYKAFVIGPCPLPIEISQAQCTSGNVGNQIIAGADSCKATYTCSCN